MSHAKRTRYIFVTGGVVSSLGKGMAAASMAVLLQERGYKVRVRKFDPYLNVDSGTISPYEHGEVYVTQDGAETDLDLGYYERFTGVSAKQSDHVTTGRIYSSVLSKERQGDYLGATVQVVPHITDAIQEAITWDVDQEDFVIWEVGGTIGDMEGLPFIEAIRQWAMSYGRLDVLFVHLTLLPFIKSAHEVKTKPSQHSVQHLQQLGIQPDILLCRAEERLTDGIRQKLSLFCNIPLNRVIDAPDVPTPYHIPLGFKESGLDREVLQYFKLPVEKEPVMQAWHHAAQHAQNSSLPQVTLGIVGKYIATPDAYKSLREAIQHAALACHVRAHMVWIDAEDPQLLTQLSACQGLMVPGGFGVRGTEGKIQAIHYARTHGLPFFGICLGMQLTVVETARHLLNLDAGSTEFGATPHPVVGLLTEWGSETTHHTRQANNPKGGTMRLGGYECTLKKGSKIQSIYQAPQICERHRHRYEVNPAYLKQLESVGLVISGTSADEHLVETVERPDHPWFIGVQYHPEFQSRPFQPHPLFVSWLQASLRHPTPHSKKDPLS